MDQAETLHTIFALRTALACILGALTNEQKKVAFARMTQIQMGIEEARDTGVPGCADALKVMNAQFECIRAASLVEPTYVQGVTFAGPAKKTPRSSRVSKK